MVVLARIVIPVALLISVVAGVVEAFSNEPDGFGAARFGMSPRAVEEAFPTLKSTGKEAFLALFELQNQSVLGLKPCTLELRFVDEKLYEISFRCDAKEKMAAALEKQFGEPTRRGRDGTQWLSQARSVTLNPESKSFTFADRSLGTVAQQKLLGYVLGQQAQGQATAAPPQPTP